MIDKRILSTIISFALFLSANGMKLVLNESDSIRISLLPEAENSTFGINVTGVSEKDKSILRYGFHNTYDCQIFEKAFLCIRKCLDLNYQIAHSDKSCVCTCYKNDILAKFKKPIDTASTVWKLGAPTTSKPAWAGPPDEKPKDYEINADDNEFIGDTVEEEHATTEDPDHEGEEHEYGEGTGGTEKGKDQEYGEGTGGTEDPAEEATEEPTQAAAVE